MDIEYQDLISVTVFKVTAGRTVKHACVLSILPAAKESSPVDWVHHFILLPHYMTAKQPVHKYCSTRQPAHTERKTSHARLHNRANMSHIIETEVKNEKLLEVAFFVICDSGSALQMCAGHLWLSCPSLGFLWWDKRKPRRLSPTQLTFQVGGWCWLQIANWRHIWKMLHCRPNKLSLSCNPGARETSSGCGTHKWYTAACQSIKYDVEMTIMIEWSSQEIEQMNTYSNCSDCFSKMFGSVYW